MAILSSIPENEREDVVHIQNSLHILGKYVDDFEDAVSLFNFCHLFRGFPLLRRWMFVPARDGAITLYNFGRAIKGIRAAMRNCPSYRALVEHEKLRESDKNFKTAFPNFEKLRHSVGHAAELREDISRQKKNSASGLDRFGIESKGLVFANSSLKGHEFFSTIDGMSVSYSLTRDSLASLEKIRRDFVAGFRGAGFKDARIQR